MTDMIYFSTCNSEIPRIVSAKLKRQLKSKIGFNDCGPKPRISGDLRIVDRSFRHLRYAEVRDGGLILYRYVGNNRVLDSRIPLYNLNINLDSPKYYCQFSLSKFSEIAPIATFQVVKEQTYKKWLKAIAVEVIRQTPLNTLKFMDILFINELLEKHQERCRPKLLPKPLIKNRIFNGHDSRSMANPLNDSSHDFSVSHNDSLQCDSYDKHKSYSADSGYCSLQSGCGKSEQSESETENHTKSKLFEEIIKKFEHQKDRKTACFNSNKFKRCHSVEPCTDEKIAKSPISEYTASQNMSDSLAEEFDVFDSNDKENRVPENNQSSPIRLTCKEHFSSKIQHYENLQSLDNNWKPGKKRSASQSDIIPPVRSLEHAEMHTNTMPDVLKDLPDTLPRTKRKPTVNFHLPEEMIQYENANTLVRLLTKCQIDKEYVPVREKRMLFESLSRFSFSVDNLKKRIKSDDRRDESFLQYRSLSDLNKNHVPVRMMKKYFESFNEKDEK